MAPRLKTFAWSDGLTEYAVAASSRPKALAAWDSDIDLFRTGLARETDDAALVSAAIASPGEVVTRPVSGGAAKALKAARPVARKAPSAAQKKIEKLQADLTALEAAQAAEVEALDERRAALEAEAAALEAAQTKAREELEKKLAEARDGVD